MSLFKKCKLDEISSNNSGQQILNNPTLESSEKMKLYNQKRILQREKHLTPYQETITPIDYTIVNDIPKKYKPYAKSILEFMYKYPDVVHWGSDGLITLNGRLIPGSNIKKTLEYLMKTTIVTQEDDIPPGSHDLLFALYGLGLPKEWVPQKIPTRTSARTRVRHPSWIKFN